MRGNRTRSGLPLLSGIRTRLPAGSAFLRLPGNLRHDASLILSRLGPRTGFCLRLKLLAGRQILCGFFHHHLRIFCHLGTFLSRSLCRIPGQILTGLHLFLVLCRTLRVPAFIPFTVFHHLSPCAGFDMQNRTRYEYSYYTRRRPCSET